MDKHTAITQLTACNEARLALNDALHDAQRRGDEARITNVHRAIQSNVLEKTKLEEHLRLLERTASSKTEVSSR